MTAKDGDRGTSAEGSSWVDSLRAIHAVMIRHWVVRVILGGKSWRSKPRLYLFNETALERWRWSECDSECITREAIDKSLKVIPLIRVHRSERKREREKLQQERRITLLWVTWIVDKINIIRNDRTMLKSSTRMSSRAVTVHRLSRRANHFLGLLNVSIERKGERKMFIRDNSTLFTSTWIILMTNGISVSWIMRDYSSWEWLFFFFLRQTRWQWRCQRHEESGYNYKRWLFYEEIGNFGFSHFLSSPLAPIQWHRRSAREMLWYVSASDDLAEIPFLHFSSSRLRRVFAFATTFLMWF